MAKQEKITPQQALESIYGFMKLLEVEQSIIWYCAISLSRKVLCSSDNLASASILFGILPTACQES